MWLALLSARDNVTMTTWLLPVFSWAEHQLQKLALIFQTFKMPFTLQ